MPAATRFTWVKSGESRSGTDYHNSSKQGSRGRQLQKSLPSGRVQRSSSSPETLKLLNPLPPKHLSICEGYLRLQSGLRGTFLSPPSKSGITRRPHTLTGIHLPIQGPPPWLRSELSSWRRSTTIRPIDLPLSVSTPLRLQLQMIGGNRIQVLELRLFVRRRITSHGNHGAITLLGQLVVAFEGISEGIHNLSISEYFCQWTRIVCCLNRKGNYFDDILSYQNTRKHFLLINAKNLMDKHRHSGAAVPCIYLNMFKASN